MRAYTVTIEARNLRQVRIAATSEVAARATAGVLLRGSDRVVQVSDDMDTRGPEQTVLAGIEALERLRMKPFFDWQGGSQVVEDWLIRATEPGLRDKANGLLALAGLRVMPDGRVAIGSPGSVPTLHGWFRATPYGGAQLMAVLGMLPGAVRSNMTFSGCHSRAVILPFATVVPAETLATVPA